MKLKDILKEVSDETIIKYKDKDGEPKEMPAKSAKTMPMDHPAKKAWDVEKAKEDGGADKKEPEAGQVSFDRTAGRDDSTKGKDDITQQLYQPVAREITRMQQLKRFRQQQKKTQEISRVFQQKK